MVGEESKQLARNLCSRFSETLTIFPGGGNSPRGTKTSSPTDPRTGSTSFPRLGPGERAQSHFHPLIFKSIYFSYQNTTPLNSHWCNVYAASWKIMPGYHFSRCPLPGFLREHYSILSGWQLPGDMIGPMNSNVMYPLSYLLCWKGVPWYGVKSHVSKLNTL